MFQILDEVQNLRCLLYLYIPRTSNVNVKWLNQNEALTNEEFKAIFPDATISGLDRPQCTIQ